MSATDKANTAGLEVVGWRFKFAAAPCWSYRDEAPMAEWSEQCRDVEPLVTAASAEARIAELEAEVQRWHDAYDIAHQQAVSNGASAQAAEARADRLATALREIKRLLSYASQNVASEAVAQGNRNLAWHEAAKALADNLLGDNP